jgi:hypothetical protein
MDSKRESLLSSLRQALKNNPFWAGKLARGCTADFTLHLAVLREPYLGFILEGKKTVETRFAKRPCPPFNRVSKGDVILLKRTPGDVLGVCIVEEAWFYRLDPKSLAFIKSKFGKAICPADSSFWEERKEASVATLILIGKITAIEPMKIEKRDRRGWVVFNGAEQQILL